MQADIKRFVFLFIDQLVVCGVRSDGVPPYLIGQQRRGVLFDVVHRLGIIRPDKIRGDVFQHFRIPVAGVQIAKTQAVLATGEIILRQRHHHVIRRNGHAAQSIKLAVGRALVGIQQNIPRIPFGAQDRLTLVDGILVAGLINMAIAIAIFGPGRGDIALRNTLHHFIQQLVLKRLLAGHDLAAIVVFLVQVVEHLWPGARIVP